MISYLLWRRVTQACMALWADRPLLSPLQQSLGFSLSEQIKLSTKCQQFSLLFLLADGTLLLQQRAPASGLCLVSWSLSRAAAASLPRSVHTEAAVRLKQNAAAASAPSAFTEAVRSLV